MTQRAPRNSSSIMRFTITLLLPLLAMGIAVTALYFNFVDRGNTNVTVTCEDANDVTCAEIIENANQTFQRAEDAVGAAELVLSFLEGFSVLAGIILVAAGVLGLASVNDLREDTEVMKAEVLQRLEDAEKQMLLRVEHTQQEISRKVELLAALERELETSIEQNQAVIDTQMKAAKEDAQLTFEALSHHIMAQRLARENNIHAAIQACRDAHELDPDNLPNNYLLGTLLIRQNKLDEAIMHLTEAYTAARTEGEHSSAPIQAALGLAVRKKGDLIKDGLERNRIYNLAENYLLEATFNDPLLLNEDRESYFGVLGSLYRRQGRIDDAITAYKRAAQITPRRSYPEINLAMLYLSDDRPEEAEIHRKLAALRAKRRLEDTPEDYWARHDFALAGLLAGDTEQALKGFEEALDLTPDVMTLDSVEARLQFLRDLQHNTEDITQALKLFDNARKRFESAD